MSTRIWAPRTMLEGSRVRSYFRLSSRLAFSAHCFGWNTATTPPSSCRGEPFQRHQAANVVGQVLQADLGARPHHANRAHDPTARRALLRPEHMLDTRAYPASWRGSLAVAPKTAGGCVDRVGESGSCNRWP